MYTVILLRCSNSWTGEPPYRSALTESLDTYPLANCRRHADQRSDVFGVTEVTDVTRTRSLPLRCGHYRCGAAVGSIGIGNAVRPIRYSSTAEAAARPSAIAHTISD